MAQTIKCRFCDASCKIEKNASMGYRVRCLGKEGHCLDRWEDDEVDAIEAWFSNKGENKMQKCPNCGTNNVKRQLSGGQLCSHCNTIAHINKVDKKIRRLKDKKRIMNILNSFKETAEIAFSTPLFGGRELQEREVIDEDDFEEVAEAIIEEV